MKTVHKLILKSYIGPMVATFFIVMFILLMNFLWNYIDDLAGKGLSFGVIIEFMSYAIMTLIPMGIPLATLLAGIMTLGDLGENNELLALKSAGISLPKILKPLIILVVFVSIGSFFVANNLVPYSYKQMRTMLYDIRNKKQMIEFRDGIFVNTIDDISIRVGHQDKKTKLLRDILIYDTRNPNGLMSTIVADSGYISMAEDKNSLNVLLYNGQRYEENRKINWYDGSTLDYASFDRQTASIPIEGFDLKRNSDDLFKNSSQALDIITLSHNIDSIEVEVDTKVNELTTTLVGKYLFKFHKEYNGADSTAKLTAQKKMDMRVKFDTIPLDKRFAIISAAHNSANQARGSMNYDEQYTKGMLGELYKARIEYHKKLTLPISILIFFLIGAPLGAIIRKGGLGLPIVVSVIFFLIYYVMSTIGQNMASEGNWTAFIGVWSAAFILFPVAIFLTYKATTDSGLMNAESYIMTFKKVRNKIIYGYDKIKSVFGSKQ